MKQEIEWVKIEDELPPNNEENFLFLVSHNYGCDAPEIFVGEGWLTPQGDIELAIGTLVFIEDAIAWARIEVPEGFR